MYFIALLAKENHLRVNGKMMTLTFFEFYVDYIKTILYSYCLLSLIKERQINSVKSCKYVTR